MSIINEKISSGGCSVPSSVGWRKGNDGVYRHPDAWTQIPDAVHLERLGNVGKSLRSDTGALMAVRAGRHRGIARAAVHVPNRATGMTARLRVVADFERSAGDGK